MNHNGVQIKICKIIWLNIQKGPSRFSVDFGSTQPIANRLKNVGAETDATDQRSG